MSALGSFEWALQTGGRLRRFDSLRLLACALRARLQHRFAHDNPAAAKRLANLSLDAIEIPASAAALQALEACRDTGLPYLLNHCVRTYLYGAILSAQQGLKHDPEFFYCAALLHDMSIATRHASVHQETGSALPPILRCHCFALASAQWSLNWALQVGWPNARAHQLADAICRHVSPAVPVSDGVEAHLLNRAAALDVAGLGRTTVPAHLRHAALAQWPKLDQNAALGSFMAAEAQAYPYGRVAWLAQRGFIERIARAE